MLKGFLIILVKELKELIRDPKILIGMIVLPLVIFPVMGLVLGYAAETAQNEAQKSTLLVLNNDGGEWSKTFISYINRSVNVEVLNGITPQDVVSQNLFSDYNSTQFVEIPPDFSQNISQHVDGSDMSATVTINGYGVFQGGGAFSNIGSTAFSVFVNGFNRAIAPDVVYISQSTIIKGEIQEGIDPATLSGLLLSQSIALPITLMIMLTYSMQIAATSVAMEKEEKTLETLLTVPVDRFAILMGKVSSTIIVAGVAAITVLIGYNYMLGSVTFGITSTATIDLVALGLVPSPLGYALLGISLFVTLLSALALAVIVSAFSKDVRGAQALVGYLYPIVFIPALVLIYLDVNTLPQFLKVILYAIPYSHPIIASKAIVLEDYVTVTFGIVYVAAFTVIIMYVASRLFATEKILTARLRFKLGFKKPKPEKE